jgi:hypothetical protein
MPKAREKREKARGGGVGKNEWVRKGKTVGKLNPRSSAPLELAPTPWTENYGAGWLPVLVKFGAR